MNSDFQNDHTTTGGGRSFFVAASQKMISTITGQPGSQTGVMLLSGYRSNIWKLYLIRTLFWTHFFAAVMVPFYTQWGHLKLSTVFVVNAWFMLWNFFLEVPTGTIADFLGRKISLALGGLVAAVAA